MNCLLTFAIDSFKEMGQSLSSIIYPLVAPLSSIICPLSFGQTPKDNSNPGITEMAMVDLNGPPNKTKSCESGKGTGMEERALIRTEDNKKEYWRE